MSKLKKYLSIIFSLVCFLFLIVTINKNNIYPSENELKELRIFLGDIKINHKEDIFRIQNKIVTEIHHKFQTSSEINILNNLSRRQGFCYERSLILQKIMVLNKIEVRPVFIFYRFDGDPTRFYNILKKNIGSHAIFEFKYKDNWYVMETNSKMNNFITLNSYMKGGSVPSNANYIRHINNRNGRFIAPSWLPDIY